eukprot:9476697-Pyramimonas_sp.AAC.1
MFIWGGPERDARRKDTFWKHRPPFSAQSPMSLASAPSIPRMSQAKRGDGARLTDNSARETNLPILEPSGWRL